jgi:hypothetical protein
MMDIVERLRMPCSSNDALRQRDEAADEIARLRAQHDQLLAALNLVMVGGNHIATYRTDRWPRYGTEPYDALEKLGAGQEYDMWCCWAAIMTARAIASVERRP